MKNRKAVHLVLKIVHRLCPSFLPLLVTMKLSGAAIPYVNIVGSSIVIDKLLQQKGFEDIFRCALWMIVLNFTLNMLTWGFDKLVNVRKYLLTEQIRKMIAEKGLTLDYEILEKKETLACIYKAREGMNANGDISVFCDRIAGMIGVIADIIYAAVLFFPVFLVSGNDSSIPFFRFVQSHLGGMALILILAGQLIVLGWSQRRMGALQKETFDLSVDANRHYDYYLSFLMDSSSYTKGKDVRMYDFGNTICENFKHDTGIMYNNYSGMQKRIEKYSFLNECCAAVFTIASYVYVGVKAGLGLISIGSVARYVGSFTKFSFALGSVVRAYTDISICAQYLAYFEKFMDIENEKYNGTLPIEKRDDNDYEFEFRDVSFSYPNSAEPVLKHVSMKLKVGKKMSLVGPNGAGKTTFIKLLCRLYDPTEGQILLNGVDIKYYDYDEYIRLFSVVFQDFKLFSFSIAENVAVSKEYDEDRVIRCLAQAGFTERLGTLKNGVHTQLYKLEKDGVEISGGEAQKIAIARALYKNSPLVILDEPTSALDPVSEYEIYRSFDKLVGEKTAIYISHRMSSCRFCNRIIVFDGGRIVQQGSHEELMEDKEGLYYEMWNAQAQYYA
ncbi:MAG: ABC transporter ATP-binding protein [Lachnospiraceae bacterium]|nr:ABC transporter ATP-binding protein [Lachnospiraceae bacterium]